MWGYGTVYGTSQHVRSRPEAIRARRVCAHENWRNLDLNLGSSDRV